MSVKRNLSLLGVLFLYFFFSLSQTVQGQTPFICDDTNFVSLGSGSRAELYTVDYSINPYGLDVVGDPAPFNYNGIGFNIKDGEIYAVARSGSGGFSAGEIVSIDAAGNITNYGASTPTTSSFSADIDENGVYYAFEGTTLIIFDTQDATFPANGAMYMLEEAFGADAVFNPKDGLLYSISGGELLTLDPADLATTTTVTVTAVPITTTGSTIDLSQAGAMWADALGRLFAYQNGGQIYEVMPTGEATFVSSAPDVSSNDGTGCAYAPIVEKSVDPAVSEPGDEITYQIVMANGFRNTDLDLNFVDQLPAGFTWMSGTYTISGDVVSSGTANRYGETDSMTVTGMTIEAGGVVTVTIDAISADEILAGTYHNQAVMDDILPSLGGEKESDWPDGADKGEPTPHQIVEVVEIDLEKEMVGYVDVDRDVLISRGDVLTYVLTATNGSNTMLNGVTVTDTLPGLSALDCSPQIPADNLSPNDIVTCTATYTVTQFDVDEGMIINTAAVTGTSPLSITVSESVSESVPLILRPEIAVVKMVTPTTDLLLNDTLSYTFVVTNTGNVTLDEVVISDTLGGLSPLVCDLTTPADDFAPNDTFTCTATYSVTQDDIDAGEVLNVATVSGRDPNGRVETGEGSVMATPLQMPSIEIVKTAVITTGWDAGDVVTYTITATNTGNVTLNEVTITDYLIDVVMCDQMIPIDEFPPNDVVRCTAIYTVTQDDVDLGVITNTVMVTTESPFEPSDSSRVIDTSDEDNAVILTDRMPEIMLGKTAVPATNLTLNDTITYTLTATNTGNSTLLTVTFNDPLLDVSCPPATLLPNDVINCTGTYTVTQDDVDLGVITNTATVTSRAPDGTFPADMVTMTVTAEQAPSIELDKVAFSSAPLLAVGDTISYTLVATNTGNVTLDPVVISDTLAGLNPIVCADALAPQEMMRCTITYTVTLTDVNSGAVINDATVRGDTLSGDGAEAADSVETPIAQSPQLTVDKQFVGDAMAVIPLNVGDLFTYTIVTTNSGNVTLDNVIVSDPLLGSLNCTSSLPTTLLPNDTIRCTGSYSVAETDVISGIIENVATATGDAPDGTVVSDSDKEVLPSDSTANIEIEKVLDFHDDVDGDGVLSADDRLGYVITTTNSGFVPLNVVVTDTIIPMLTCFPAVPTALQPNETITCTGDYTIDQTDTNAGYIVNIATAIGTSVTGAGDAVGDMATVIVPQPQLGDIVFNKAVVPSASGFALGDTVTYRFFVINVGNVALDDVMVTDPLPGLSPLACDQPLPADNFNPGDIVTCVATYEVTLDDVNAGVIVNNAAASGMTPNGNVIEDENDEIVPILQTASIIVEKTADSTAPLLTVGDTVTYTITATNTGDVTLSNVVVSDTLVGLSRLQCTDTTIVPMEAVVCTATYTVTLADVDAGAIINSVTVVGDAPNGDETAASDSVETPIAQSPNLRVDKWLSMTLPMSYTLVTGDVLTYTIITTNTGNVTISDVVVIDVLLGVLTCDSPLPAVLAPSEQLICTGNYTVLPPDVEAGLVVNSVTATGRALGSALDGTSVRDGDSVNVPPETTAAVEIEKLVTSFDDVDHDRGMSVGDVLGYLVIVDNRGVVPLSNVVISDTIIPQLSCDPAMTTTLQPNGSIMCSGSYTVTQSDIDVGEIVNTATITVTTPEGDEIGDMDTEIVPQTQRPRLTLSKVATPTTLIVDDIITYTLTATNTGNVTLDGVVISDTLFGLGDLVCDRTVPADGFAPNETIYCTAVYTVTQIDIDNGTLTNTATVHGTDPNGEQVFATDDETISATQTPGIVLNKALLPLTDPIELGDILTYQFFVINVGNVTLDNVVISDTLPGLGAFACDRPLPADSLDPAEIISCTAAYTVTQSDMDNGEIVNTATLSSIDLQGNVWEDEDDETIEIEQRPELFISKIATSNSPILNPNDNISYTFTVTNTGNVTVDNVNLIDPLVGLSQFDCSITVPASLSPNQSFTCTAIYTVTSLNVDDGSVFNTVTVIGNAPNGDVVGDVDSTDSPIVQSPQLTADKFLANDSMTILTGDALTYTILITNTGNVNIDNVMVSDPLLETITCAPVLPTTFLPGEHAVCSGQYIVTQADVNQGNVTNTVTTTGNAPDGTAIEDSDNEDATLDNTPNVEVEKSLGFHDDVDGDGELSVGDRLAYEIIVVNDGRSTLSGLILEDTIISDVVCTPAVPVVLDPDEVVRCDAVYTIQQADVDNGEIINTVTGRGTSSDGRVVEDSDTEILPQPQLPNLWLEKVIVERRDDLIVGDVITYMLTATNTGNLTLDDVVITDTLLGVSELTCDRPMPVNDFAPNDTLACTATYTVTQTDVDNGTIDNTATVTGVTQNGFAFSVTDTEQARGNQKPAILLHKSSTVPSGADIGDVITYTFVATNTGNVTLYNVSITDPLSGLSELDCDRSLPISRLSPDETVHCTATYLLKALDFTFGIVMNTATAVGSSPDGTVVEASAEDAYALVRPASTPTPMPTATSASVPIPLPTIQPTQQPEPAVVLNYVATFDPNGGALTGTVIFDFGVLNYVFTITNTGNVPLTNAIVTDPLIMIVGEPTHLGIGETATFLGSYVLTSEDYAAGSVVENAVVTAEWMGESISFDERLDGLSDEQSSAQIGPKGVLEGAVWHDLDVSRDGVRAAVDVPLAGIRVLLMNSDGSVVGETVTDLDGIYRFFDLPLNETYRVVVDSSTLPIEKEGMVATYEADTVFDNSFEIALTFDQPIVRQLNFTYVAADFGDLPDSYMTNGNGSPAHILKSFSDQFYLGNTISYEKDGQSTSMADGDLDDGIEVIGNELFVAGETKLIKVRLSGHMPPEGVDLGVWFDWDHNGQFTQDEFTSYRLPGNLSNGTLTLPSVPNIPIVPPEDYKANVLSARFRVFTIDGAPGGTLDWTDFAGPALNGEVEDYIFAGATAVNIQTTPSTTASWSFTLTLLSIITVMILVTFDCFYRQYLFRSIGRVSHFL